MSFRTLIPIAILLLGTAGSLASWLGTDRSSGSSDDGTVRGAIVTQEELQTRAADAEEQKVQARARDEKRLYDLRLLLATLERYRAEHKGNFPGALNLLIPAYLRELPRDPLSGEPYAYHAPPVNAQFYTITYALETGAQNVTAGQHTATPMGVATP